MSAPVHLWIAAKLPADVRRAIDRVAAAPDVLHVAIMPDVHLASEVCVGTVVATSRLIYPDAAGSDIGCGMAAVAVNGDASLLRDAEVARGILRDLTEAIPPIRRHRPAAMPQSLAGPSLSDPALESLRARDGAVEFATLGRGNHFLELQADEHQQLWWMVHSGSRAMGPAVRDFHTHVAEATRSRELVALDATTSAGQAYLNDMSWCRAYATASRRAMLEAAQRVMRSRLRIDLDWSSYFDCDHNH